MRIVRVKVLHPGTFAAIVSAAVGAQQCLQYRDRCYERIAGRRRAGVYRLSSHGLAWIQERVEAYEFSLFSSLLTGVCGRDGMIRRHTTGFARQPNGAYRPLGPGRTQYLQLRGGGARE